MRCTLLWGNLIHTFLLFRNKNLIGFCIWLFQLKYIEILLLNRLLKSSSNIMMYDVNILVFNPTEKRIEAWIP